MRIGDDAKIMKRLDTTSKLLIGYIIFLMLMLVGTTCKAQVYNITEWEFNADLKVKIVDHKWDADRIVCIVEKYEVNRKKSWISLAGQWYEGKAIWFTEHDYKANEKWYITRHRYETTRQER